MPRIAKNWKKIAKENAMVLDCQGVPKMENNANECQGVPCGTHFKDCQKITRLKSRNAYECQGLQRNAKEP